MLRRRERSTPLSRDTKRMSDMKVNTPASSSAELACRIDRDPRAIRQCYQVKAVDVLATAPRPREQH
jgi:hypothetical protein